MRIHATVVAVVAFGGLALAAPAAADDTCPPGQISDGYTGECVLDIEPVSFYDGPMMQSGIGSVNGIPCTPEHIGTCIGMTYNQPSYTQPHSTLSHSP